MPMAYVGPTQPASSATQLADLNAGVPSATVAQMMGSAAQSQSAAALNNAQVQAGLPQAQATNLYATAGKTQSETTGQDIANQNAQIALASRQAILSASRQSANENINGQQPPPSQTAVQPVTQPSGTTPTSTAGSVQAVQSATGSPTPAPAAPVTSIMSGAGPTGQPITSPAPQVDITSVPAVENHIANSKKPHVKKLFFNSIKISST